MGYFDKVEQTRSSKGGVFITPGRYVLDVNAIKIVENHEGRDFCAVELIVVESNVADRPPGLVVSWVQEMKNSMFLPNFKSFLMALFNRSEEDIDKELCEMVSDERQAAAGWRVACEAVSTLTKKEKKPFTKLNWTSVEQPAQAA